MKDATKVTPLRAGVLIGKGVLIELQRRKDLYVLVFLMSLFLVSVLVARIIGIQEPATATFLLNLGMSLAVYAAHLLTLLLALRQMPDEIEHRTLYPLLAKPVGRATLVVAKWAACAACGTAAVGVLLLLGGLPVPRLEAYATGTLLQTLVCLPISLSMLAALALCLSLILPRGTAAVVAGGLFFGSGALIGLAGRVADSGLPGTLLAWTALYLPDFGKLNLVTRYTDGIPPLGPAAFGGLLLYGALCTALYLAVAAALFQRRSV